jgi:hypothetical protein
MNGHTVKQTSAAVGMIRIGAELIQAAAESPKFKRKQAIMLARQAMASVHVNPLTINWSKCLLNLRMAGVTTAEISARTKIDPDTIRNFLRGKSEPRFTAGMIILDLHFLRCPERTAEIISGQTIADVEKPVRRYAAGSGCIAPSAYVTGYNWKSY